MVQKIFGLGLGATGIVGVLIIAGILLAISGANAEASTIAIWAGVIIAIFLGGLGVIGVIISTLKRIF